MRLTACRSRCSSSRARARLSIPWIACGVLLPALLAARPRRQPASPAPPAAVLAPAPPMGWNSWDSYAMSLDQSQFEATARYMARHLRRYGWRYMVIDEGWFLKNPLSNGKPAWRYTLGRHGILLPAPNRFPLSRGGAGFKPLAAFTHRLGLRFGIHILRGIPRLAVERNLPIAGSKFHARDAANTADTCAWNQDNYGVRDNAAGQAWYDALFRRYARWGVDYVKVDCISSPYIGDEIRMIHRAIVRSGRPIVLSLSPGPAPLAKGPEVVRLAQLWRISGDFWDHWGPLPQAGWSQGLQGQFQNLAAWEKYAGPGHWPDADMLPIGYIGPQPGLGPARHSRFTRDEQQTILTLWSIARSPLMMGGNLLKMNAFTRRLLTNPEVLAVDQHSTANRAILTTRRRALWRARAPGQGSKTWYVAVFNLENRRQTFRLSWKDWGLPRLSGRQFSLRDLWRRKNLGDKKQLLFRLRPHASALLSIRLLK